MTRGDKLERFLAKPEQKFTTWFQKFEIHVRREKLTEEADKIDELFFYLDEKPLEWFEERRELGSLPETLKEIKDLLNEEFGAGAERICRMTNGDLAAYIKQFEEITKVFKAEETLKVTLFKNGLDGRYYPSVANSEFKSYQAIKSFVQGCQNPTKEDSSESFNVFRANETKHPTTEFRHHETGKTGGEALDRIGRMKKNVYIKKEDVLDVENWDTGRVGQKTIKNPQKRAVSPR